jgi:hypothetical protein
LIVSDVHNIWRWGMAQPVASSKEKEDIEWWIVSDGIISGGGAWRSPSQAPKRRKT